MKELIKKYWWIILILIIAVVWFVQDYQKAERQYQACSEVCRTKHNVSGLQGLLGVDQPQEYKICRAECGEKYGK